MLVVAELATTHQGNPCWARVYINKKIYESRDFLHICFLKNTSVQSCTATLWVEYLCFVSELKCYSFLRANLTCCLSEQEITTTTRFERDTLALLNLRK